MNDSPKQTSSDSKLSNRITPPQALIYKFLKELNFLIKKMDKISRQTDQEKRTTELRGLIFLKPHIQEAMIAQNFMKDVDPDFFKDIIHTLTNDIELSHQCLQNLRNFYQTTESLSPSERTRQTKHIVESTWEQIYKLSIYDPVLIDELSKLEWICRARDVLHHKKDNFYPFIEYCELLKKGAIESQSQGIKESKLYKRIEEDLQRYKSLIEKVRSILNPEKMDIENAKRIFREWKESGFGMNQEVKSVEEILHRAGKIEQHFHEVFKNNSFLAPRLDLKELKNFPLKFSGIEEYLNELRNDQKLQVKAVLQKTSQRINEKNNELHEELLRYGVAHEKEYWRAVEEMQNIKKFSAELIQKLPAFKFEDFCFLTQQSTAISKGHEHLKAELWLAKMKMLQIYCNGIGKPLKSITVEKLYSFLFEIKEYIDSLPGPKRTPFDQQISFLENILQEISAHIAKNQETRIFYGFIDATKPLPQKGESLNQNRSRTDDDNEIEETYEKIEKKMKKQNDIPQIMISSSPEEEFEAEREKIEVSSDQMENDVEEITKKEEEDFQNSQAPRGKMKKAQEFWNKLNDEKLFDEVFALENNGFGNFGLDSNYLLDCFSKEFWNQL